MTRPHFTIAVLGLLAGCVSAQDREARCACFTQDGNPTGNCDFVALQAGSTGVSERAVFKFLPDDQAAASAGVSFSHSPIGTSPREGAKCRG